jgi:hypothetical protein
MKRLPWIFLLLGLYSTAAGQRNSDYGIFAGVSSYLGDINPNRLMYSPLPAGGIFTVTIFIQDIQLEPICF